MESQNKNPAIKAKTQKDELEEIIRKNETFQRKIYMFGIAAVVSIFASVAVVLIPSINEITVHQREIQQEKEVKEQLETKLAKLQQLRIKYQQIEPDLKYFDYSYPYERDIPTIIANVSEIAAKSGVILKVLEYGDNAAVPTTLPLTSSVIQRPVTISIDSNYDELKVFLEALEKFPRIMNIDTLNFSYSEGRDAKEQKDPIQTAIKVFLYYRTNP